MQLRNDQIWQNAANAANVQLQFGLSPIKCAQMDNGWGDKRDNNNMQHAARERDRGMHQGWRCTWAKETVQQLGKKLINSYLVE